MELLLLRFSIILFLFCSIDIRLLLLLLYIEVKDVLILRLPLLELRLGLVLEMLVISFRDRDKDEALDILFSLDIGDDGSKRRLIFRIRSIVVLFSGVPGLVTAFEFVGDKSFSLLNNSASYISYSSSS